jgi:Spy/CpxP family protein refolding chaperone
MEPSDASPRTVRLLTAILLVATFAAGTVTGVGVCKWIAPPHAPPPPPPMAGGPLPFEQLDLSPEQQEKVHAILERHRPELEAVLRESFPRVRAINEKIEREVREVLTAEQQKRLEEIKARRPPPPPGAPPGPPGPWGPPPPSSAP